MTIEAREFRHNALEVVTTNRRSAPNCYRLCSRLTDQVDWDTALREDAGRVNSLGLYDLDRRIRPAGAAYRELVRRWGGVLAADPEPGLAVGH